MSHGVSQAKAVNKHDLEYWNDNDVSSICQFVPDQ